jgi:hypothetical protein
MQRKEMKGDDVIKIKVRPSVLSASVLLLVCLAHVGAVDAKVYSVREYGAKGDGQTLDTAAINKSIEACSAAGGGRVEMAAGTYLTGSVHLLKNVDLHLDLGATLLGSARLQDYENYAPPAIMPESKALLWHRALVLADGAQNISISGQGVIDGQKVFDAHGEEHMRGPHTILLGNCRGITLRDISIKDSGNYAVLLELADQVEIRNVKISGGWDGVHFRGCRKQPCHDVTIANCQFFTGDDSIAGRYWDRVRITDCVLNSSCNCVRLIGPAEHLTIEKCRMYGPGEYPHRTSNRHNCLAGLNLQPGAWDGTQGKLDDVTISDITMDKVATPFHFVLKPGNTAGRIAVSRVKATGVYFTASSIESWAETPFADVSFRDVSIQFVGGGKSAASKETVHVPGNDPRPLPAWAFYLRNVQNLSMANVHVTCAQNDLRPVLIADHVKRLTLSGVTWPRVPGAEEPLVASGVEHLENQN